MREWKRGSDEQCLLQWCLQSPMAGIRAKRFNDVCLQYHMNIALFFAFVRFLFIVLLPVIVPMVLPYQYFE